MENITQAQFWSSTSSGDLGEPIEQSLRFRNGQRLVSSDTKPTGDFTYSCWFKPAAFTTHTGRDAILMFGPNQSYQIGDSNTAEPGGGRLMVVNTNISGSIGPLSNGSLTDVSAWYHIVIINESNTSRCYINGVKQTSTAATPDGSSVMTIGSNSNSSQDDPLLGYLAEVNLLDGTVIGHTTTNGRDIINEFGRFNEDGVWVPKKIELTAAQYGAKGFRLQFNDTSNLGDDSAPVGSSGHTATNDLTANGFSAADDDINDTPTNNHGTLNSQCTTTGEYQAANLEFETDSHGSWKGGRGTFPMDSGKWYWEATCGQDDVIVGISSNTRSSPGFIGSAGEIGYQDNGNKFNASGTGSSYGSTFKAGDVIGVAFDADGGNIWFSVNGTWQNSATAAEIAAGTTGNAAFTSLANELYVPVIFNASAGTNTSFNFGQASFSNTPPTGYKALATNNMTKPDIKNGEKHFGALTYSAPGSPSFPITINGSGGNNGTGNLDFEAQPDLVWIKMRNAGQSHTVFDSLRGNTKSLRPDETGGEANRTNFAFATDGFTFSAQDAETYQQNDSYIAWCWKAGGAPTTDNTENAGVAQTAGSVKKDGSNASFATGTIAVKKISVNTTAGFSIVEYEGTGSAGKFPHGLGKKPEWALIKRTDGTGAWSVYHDSMGNQNRMKLDVSDKMDSFGTGNDIWNGESPDENLFSIGTSGDVNTDDEQYIAYLWAPVEGYSKFGEYAGNGDSTSEGSNGTHVTLGFRPAWIMVKTKSGANGSWSIYDNVRSTSNPNTNTLVADDAAGQVTAGNDMDFLANGFKCRDSGSINNGSGNVYLYMAFGEHPFGGDTAAPANAY